MTLRRSLRWIRSLGWIQDGARSLLSLLTAPFLDDACAACDVPLEGPSGPACAACRAAVLQGGGSARRTAPQGVLTPHRHVGVARRLIHALKYGRRREVAPLLAEALLADRRVRAALADADVLVPVPATPGRRAARGFDQAEEIARALSAARPPAQRLRVVRALTRRDGDPSQVGRGRRARQAAVRGAFRARGWPFARSLRGQRVVLVDDVVTTGATARAAARVLRRTGAASITVIAVTRADP